MRDQTDSFILFYVELWEMNRGQEKSPHAHGSKKGKMYVRTYGLMYGLCKVIYHVVQPGWWISGNVQNMKRPFLKGDFQEEPGW